MNREYQCTRIRYNEMCWHNEWDYESRYTITSDTVSFAKRKDQPDRSKSNVFREHGLHGASAVERGATS